MSAEPTLIAAPVAVEPSSMTTAALQRTCECGAHVSGGGECDACRRKRAVAPPLVHDVLRAPGRPLERRTRRSLEASFGRDFSQIRVHADERAAESARAVDAAAYAVGPHLVFGAGRYAPSTTAGRRLLAHELAHTVQQSGAAATAHPLPVRDDPADERAADSAAAAALAGAPRSLAPAQVGVQRQVATTTTTGAAGGAGKWAPSSDCVKPVSGDELEALLQSRAVTIVDLWASWCNPCKMLAADLDDLCKKYRAKPPAAPIRFFSVDVEDPANKAIADRYYTNSLPQLLIFVGPTLEQRIEERPEPEITEEAIETAIDHAARSGAARGFWKGAKIGATIGGIGGLAAGIGLAFAGILTGGLGLLAVFGLAAAGVLGGGLLGGAIGAFAGWLSDKRDISGNARRGGFEADALIRKRFGADIPRGTAPLHGAPVRAVTQAELRALWECRHDPEKAGANIIGWTDTGPDPSKPAIADQAGEPTCASGKQLEHATEERPVIYYAKDVADATVVIHEGLHAYEHQHFSAQLRNNMSEATTEYFTRQIASDIDVKATSGYDQWLEYVAALVKTIGEPALRAAYFRGDFGPANAVLGKCGLEAWAQHHLQYEQQQAAAVLEKRGGDYCKNVIKFPERVPPGQTGAQGTQGAQGAQE
jgi:thiol-disulfide isomerase/thioredoxin